MIEQPKSYLKILELVYDTESTPIEDDKLIKSNSQYLEDLAKLRDEKPKNRSIFWRLKNVFARN